MSKYYLRILILFLIGHSSEVLGYQDVYESNDFQNYSTIIHIFPDSSCNESIDQVVRNWDNQSWKFSDSTDNYFNNLDYEGCFWTRLMIVNTDTTSLLQALYFPKGWQRLEVFKQGSNDFEKTFMGLSYRKELLHIEVEPADTVVFYIKYPPKDFAFFPSLGVSILDKKETDKIYRIDKFKYFLLGVMLFPLFFFLSQIVVYKEKISLYYFIFLVGCTVHLATILEATPYFELTSKIFTNARHIQYAFITSSFLIFFGLIKYVEQLLNLDSWSEKLTKVGNYLLIVFFGVAMVPFFAYKIFHFENYSSYLQYFRMGALLCFLLVVVINILAVRNKIKFSKVLAIALSPLLLSGINYVLSFIIAGDYTWKDLESFILLGGFMMTIFMFGAILGFRNKSVRRKSLILEQKAEQLRELDLFKTRFYTNITHEFRTPLTVIKGVASQINIPEKTKDVIRRNCDRLLNLVNQLLDLSKAENNQISVTMKHGDVVPFLRYIVQSLQSWALSKQISLSFYSSVDSLCLDFDEDKLQKIIVNLVSNAIKHIPQYASVKVKVSKVANQNHEYMKIDIEDTGQGIKDEDLPHIFDLFYQVGHFYSEEYSDDPQDHTHRFHRDSGAGIGLSLVKELIEILDGKIDVKTKVDHGSTFTVMLPINHHAKKTIQFERATASPVGYLPIDGEDYDDKINRFSNNNKPQILIIEDNMDVVDYIISCVENKYDWKYARDGKHGYNDAIEFIPDVIICDLMLPELNGFEVCRRLKEDVKTSHIPIVILTAKATKEDKLKGLSLGASAFLSKPFDKKELIIRLNNLSAEHRLLVKSLRHGKIDTHSKSSLKESQFLSDVNQIIEQKMENEIFDTNFLCRELGMSRTQLYRKLKALTDQSTASYIKSKRMQKARDLIVTTDLSIGEISTKVGFKDFSHFSNSFSKTFQMKPSDLRS